MSILSYAGVNFGQVRTAYYTEEPTYDDAGQVDPLTTCLTLEVESVINPSWLASNVAGGVGDRAGLTVNNIRAALETPRQQLIFAVGPDRIIATPAVDPTDPNGVRLLPCDARNGPLPQVIRFVEIVGDKSIMVRFRVQTWFRNSGNILMSNRWSITSDTDFQGLTTRIIRGQAVIRADAIGLFGIHGADDFRRAIFMSCPNNFIRQNPVVEQSVDGTTVNYTITDVETGLTLGANCVAVEIEGNATSGSESQIKDLPGLTNTVTDMFVGAFQLNIPAIINQMKSAVPQNKASALVRCYGNRLPAPNNIGKREALTILAAKIIEDRFGDAFIVSSYATQGLDSLKGPWAEVRIEYFVTLKRLLNGAVNVIDFGAQFASMADDIIMPGETTIRGHDPTAQNPPQPGGGNTRGSYLGALVAQTFAPAGKIPNAPPADAVATNVPAF